MHALQVGVHVVAVDVRLHAAAAVHALNQNHIALRIRRLRQLL